MKYILRIGRAPVNVFSTFEEAADAAFGHLNENELVTIETYAAPAPTQTWIYDRKLCDWVEQIS